MADAKPTFSCRSDIRSAKQKQLSRPMTGHTPQKLPSFDAISCIIAVRAQNDPTRARLSYHLFPHLSRIFLEKISKFCSIFHTIRRTKKPPLCKGRCHGEAVTEGLSGHSKDNPPVTFGDSPLCARGPL